MVAYYAKHREKLKARSAANQKANKEQRLAYNRKYRAEHPEMMSKSRRKWDEKNLEAYKPRKRELEKIRMMNPEARKRSAQHTREYRKKNPTKARRATMDWHYRSKYGITLAERDALFEMQGKRCKVCRSDSSKGRGFHVDHCHTTKKIRGIVCHHCNVLLGYAKDDIAILKAAIQYLKESQ